MTWKSKYTTIMAQAVRCEPHMFRPWIKYVWVPKNTRYEVLVREGRVINARLPSKSKGREQEAPYHTRKTKIF